MARLVGLTSLFLALAIAGCGNTVEPTDAGHDGGTSPTSDGGVDAGRAETDGGTDTGPIGTDGGHDGGPVDVDTGATTSATVTITDFFVGGNCKPIVPADPINVGWTAQVSGATGTTAVLTSATLHLVPPSGAAFTQTLTIDPTSIPLTSGSGTAAQHKTSGTPDPTNACGTLCNSAATLDLVFQIDGASVHGTASGNMGCAL